MAAIEPGYQFASDNTAGICPEAWEAMQRANHGRAAPYGNDHWTARAKELIREIFEADCEVFFTFNGTAANSLAIASMCRSFHSLIAHKMSHVETDECGCPEFFSGGTKLLLVGGDHGRVTPDNVDQMASRRRDVHFPKAKAVSVTQSTELGTVYHPDDLQAIGETAAQHRLRLHMDGSRFANALSTLDVAAKEITWKIGVDVLCLGGTKNGMAVGDCIVFFDPDLASEFDYRCKQAGQLASKMRYLTAPWVGMLESGAWLRNAAHANRMAKLLAARLSKLPGIEIAEPVDSNAVFVDWSESTSQRMQQAGWAFYSFAGVRGSRLMCSWLTTEYEIDALVRDAAEIS